jgi:glycosyltransferase involved in cell wall biosynthesis
MGISWRTGILARWCRKEGSKFVLWLASITDPLAADPKRSRVPKHGRWLAHRGLKEAHLVIAQTEEQAQLMRELYHRECPVIPNVWVVSPTEGLKAEPPEVFWAARYLPLKRPEMVLEAARRLPHLRFVMAGGPARGHEALFEEVQRAAQEVPNLQALGFVPFSEIDQYYARARAYLCTSTIEGFPNTFLQAWNHKTPVVTTYDPDGVISRYGLGAGCQDLDEVVAGLEGVCGPEGAAIGERCRAYLQRVHSVEAVMAALEPLLLSLAG